MQLAAQRIALNLHEAGFNVQVANTYSRKSELFLRKLPIAGADPGAVLQEVLWAAGYTTPVIARNSASLYKIEQTILDEKKLIPLLDLPRAYASGPRVRDLRLRADGTPDLANASLGDAR
jgi:hypothetical protein